MDAREELDMSVVTRLRQTLITPIVTLARTAWQMVPQRAKESWVARTTVETIRLLRKNRVMGIAAEVSFWALLSITPLLLVSASTLGWIDSIFGIDVADDARDALTDAVREVLGIGNQAVESIDTLFDNPSASGLTFGLLASLYASSRGFTSLIGGIDHVTGRAERRNFVTTRIAGFVAALLSVPALVALLVLANIGRTGFGLPQPWNDIVAVGMWPLIAVGLTGFALTLLHSSPADRTPLRSDLLGAVVAAAIWLGGSWVAALSLASFGTDVLGILGGSVGLLFWLYIMTSGILIGAEVNVARQNVAAAASIEPVAVPDLYDDEPEPDDSDPIEGPSGQASGSTRSAS